MTKQDREYRQGRSKKQLEASYKVTALSAGLLFITIVLSLTYSIIFG